MDLETPLSLPTRVTCRIAIATPHSAPSRMPHLEITNLSHRYAAAKQAAVADVSLSLKTGEIVALIGGSGSGKSTLLRCVAGLENPNSGTVTLGGRHLNPPRPVPPERRKIGMVSQSGDLFPHLNILRNTAFGLRKLARAERRDRALEALSLVGLADFAQRYPAELSGGEAQRVALARALAFQPDLLLLDEPFSSLDVILREQLRTLTLDIIRQKGITTLFVTHHGDDALAAGDRIAVLRDGKLIQCDQPRQIWKAPADPGVAALFGGINVLPSNLDSALVYLRPEQLRLCPLNPNCLTSGTVERVDFLGSNQLVLLRVPGSEPLIRVRVSPDHAVTPGMKLGVEATENDEASSV